MLLKTLLLISIATVSASGKKSLYDFTLQDITGKDVDFSVFKGQTLLLTNTASQCSSTDSHYKSLKRLHDILSPSNFSVLAFPCNDFGEQEPWDEKEIEEFVRGHFKAEFYLFKKVKILDKKDREPLWDFVIETSETVPSWNFQKYLFDKEGRFVESWGSDVSVEGVFERVSNVMRGDSTVVKKGTATKVTTDKKNEL